MATPRCCSRRSRSRGLPPRAGRLGRRQDSRSGPRRGNPVAAANAYLLTVFDGSEDELGIRRCLCDSRQAELLSQARALRADLANRYMNTPFTILGLTL